MAVIGVKSITGITSITNAAGGADVLTFHSNNTTERLRITSDGEIRCTGASDNKGFSVWLDGTRRVAEIIEHSSDGEIRLYTGESTPVLRTVLTSYGDSYINAAGDSGTGKVGIGTATPSEILTVHTATGNTKQVLSSHAGFSELDFTTASTLRADVFANASEFTFTTRTAIPIVFRTNGTNERLRIDSGGRIGIGTDSPGTRDANGSVDIVQNHANTGPHFRVLNKHATLGGGVQFKCNNARGGLEFLNSSGTNNGSFYHSTGGWTWDQTLQLIGGSGLRIGTTSGSGYLINAKTSSADAFAKIESESGYDAALLLDTSNGGGATADVRFQMDGSTKGSIQYVNNASSADVNCMIFRTTANNERLRIKADGNIVATGNLKTNNITGKNLVINGSFQVDQRNDGAELSITSNNKFSADRWTHNNDGHTYYKTQRRNDGPIQTIGTEYYMRATVTTAVTLSGSTSQCLENNLEGNTVRWLNLGTSGAKQCTLSFWVRCSLTGTFGGALVNSAYNRCHPFSYTVSSANTWEYKTYTFSTTGFTTGSFLTNNGVGLRLVFSYGNGSGRQADPANGWSTQVKFGPTGETNLVATNGATMDIASVQLEEGTQATRFDHKSYAEELRLCQRYYNEVANTRNQGGNDCTLGMFCQVYDANGAHIIHHLDPPMRAVPNLKTTQSSGSYILIVGNSSDTFDSIIENSKARWTNQNVELYATGNLSGLTAGHAAFVRLRSAVSTTVVAFESEL